MDSELTIRDYLHLLRRRAWLVAAIFLAAVAAALIYSAAQTPLYRSTARILVNQSSAADIFDPVSGVPVSFADRMALNEIALLQSDVVADEVAERLGFAAGVRATPAERTDVIVITATSPDPARAQLVAQTYAEAYIDVRRDQFVFERLDTAETLFARIAEIEAQVADTADPAARARLERLRDRLADAYDELSLTADLADTASARIIDAARRPAAPFVPQTNRNIALGAVLGLMMGAGAALLLESLDNSVRSRSVIEQLLPGTPALAVIPKIKGDDELVSLNRPDSIESEAFKSLRAGLDFVAVDHAVSVIQVTSPHASAGKTTIAANLAVVIAATGKTVIVVDADLRRPRLHSVFKMAQVPGFTTVLLGRTTVKDVARPTKLDNGRLFTIASGPVPPGPSELLGSERARVTFERLRRSADVIIVDSPPVLPVVDALVISKLVDATILVANAKSTKRDALVRAHELLVQAGAPVVGTILNEVSSRSFSGDGYGYGYGYGYGTTDGSGPRLFGRSSAPRHSGTAVLPVEELPRFEAAQRPKRGRRTAAAPAEAADIEHVPQTSGDSTRLDIGPEAAASAPNRTRTQPTVAIEDDRWGDDIAPRSLS